MKRTVRLLFLGMIGISPTVMAQQKTITGTVTSAEAGAPLEGVTIMVRETGTQSQTNAQGAYTVSVQQGQTLIFQSVGFQQAERMVGEAATIDVALSASEEALGEVVVTAMGIRR